MNKATKSEDFNIDSLAIDWLRFPLALGVVLLHCFGEPSIEAVDLDNLQSHPFQGDNFYHFFRIFLSDTIARLSVPTFFLISGYLYFLNTERYDFSVYLYKTKKRLKSLLLPYLIWNIIGICFFLGRELFYNHEINLQAWDFLRFFGFYGVGSPIVVPLWFIRSLMIICFLLTPVIWFVIRHTPKWEGLIIFPMIYVFFSNFELGILAVQDVFWFSMGAFFSIKKINLTSWCMARLKWSVPIAFAFAIASCYHFNYFSPKGNFYFGLFLLFGVVSVMGAAGLFIKKYGDKYRASKSIVKNSSFFIFAFHSIMPISISSVALLYIFDNNTIAGKFMIYILTPALTIAICLICLYVLNRFFPRALKVINGR